MSDQKVVVPSSNLDTFYTKPNNLVDLFENSAAKFASRNLFGTKNKTTDQYEWVTYDAVALRVIVSAISSSTQRATLPPLM